MTQDEIIRMMKEAGFYIGKNDEFEPAWERFAALVAAHAVLAEREACAKVCEDYIDRLHDMRDNDPSLPMYQPELAGRQAGAGRCAAAIRARGEKNV